MRVYLSPQIKDSRVLTGFRGRAEERAVLQPHGRRGVPTPWHIPGLLVSLALLFHTGINTMLNPMDSLGVHVLYYNLY